MNYILFQHLKFQIAAAVIMMVLEVFYILRPKFNLRSTKMFIALMSCSLVYLAFDVLTVIGLVYYDKFSHTLVDWFHRGFIFFIDLTFVFIYAYLEVVSHHQKKLKTYKRVFITASMIAAVIMLFSPIKYHIAPNAIYSYGPMVYSAYVIIGIYSLTILISSAKKFFRKKTNTDALFILITILIWAVFAFIQLTHPETLISSIGISAMILMMYLSLQNPSNYMDKDTDCVNHMGLKFKLQDLLYNKKHFQVLNLDLEGFDSLQNQLGEENSLKLLNNIKDFLRETTHLRCYRFSDNAFTILINPRNFNKSEQFIEKIEQRFSKRWEINDQIKIKIPAHIDFIDIPHVIGFETKSTELMNFIKNCHTYSNSTTFIHRADKGIINSYKKEAKIIEVLKKAITNDEIEIYYQPIYSTKDKKFTNVEALVRLTDDKTCGFVSPEVFIPLAEKNHLIVELSNRIFHRIFDFISKNDLKNLGVKHVEINLSAIQSVDTGLPAMLLDLLSQYNVPPTFINLEVTESVAITSVQTFQDNIAELRSHGFSFSMDDFGTGYSNLSQIAKTDFELIKIDKSLLWPIFKQGNKDTEKSKILLESMIKMIQDMGLKIVVEGVENQNHVNYLEKLGVDYMQGYNFSRPIRGEDYLDFLSKHQ